MFNGFVFNNSTFRILEIFSHFSSFLANLIQALIVCYNIFARGQLNCFQLFNRTNFYFLNIEIFKNYCLSIFDPMNFLMLGIGSMDSL